MVSRSFCLNHSSRRNKVIRENNSADTIGKTKCRHIFRHTNCLFSPMTMKILMICIFLNCHTACIISLLLLNQITFLVFLSWAIDTTYCIFFSILTKSNRSGSFCNWRVNHAKIYSQCTTSCEQNGLSWLFHLLTVGRTNCLFCSPEHYWNMQTYSKKSGRSIVKISKENFHLSSYIIFLFHE